MHVGQKPCRLDGTANRLLWDCPGLVTCLSALLLAHSRLGAPNPYQQALLLQASAQLASLPCVRALSSARTLTRPHRRFGRCDVPTPYQMRCVSA